MRPCHAVTRRRHSVKRCRFSVMRRRHTVKRPCHAVMRWGGSVVWQSPGIAAFRHSVVPFSLSLRFRDVPPGRLCRGRRRAAASKRRYPKPTHKENHNECA